MKKFFIFTVFILSHINVNANGINLICSNDNLCENCPKYETIIPIEDFSKYSDTLDIEADQSEIVEDKYLLSGNVEVNSKSLYLAAENVEVSSSDNSILANGKVKFQDESYLITSDYLSASRENENLIATATKANYQDYSAGLRGANGFTEVIEKTPTSVLLTNSTYSLCPINQNDWQIDADQIELNLVENRGVADNATLKFYGVPIFYTPKYSWVLSGRGSGFLTPDYSTYNEAGQNQDSYSARVPYYFNLAPDRDLTVALNYMSSRRFVYEAKYRQLLAPKSNSNDSESNFEAEIKYLPEDKITGLKRWLINFSQVLNIDDKTNLTTKYYRVSDVNYFKEIDRSNTNLKTLKSFISLKHENKDNNLAVEIITEDEQIVNAGVPEYVKALEGSLSKTFNQGENQQVQIDLVRTKFTHDTASKEKGIRTYGNLGISRKLNIEFPSITPRANVAITNYSLQKNPNINRTVLGSGLDIDFTTLKYSEVFGYQAIHQFSPIISYNYRAKKIQGNIPIFDSTDKYDSIISFADLTSGERYTGLDRITNANDITLSLESTYRKIDALDDDKDLLSMKIAQTYFTDDEVVSDSANINYEKRKTYSDIAASVDLAVNNFEFKSSLQFDPDKSKITKKQNTISYSLSSRKFISLSFIDEGTKETEKFYGAYPVTENIHVFGGIDKNSSTGITNSETTGIAYESCCWALRLAHFKEDNASDGYNFGTRMELVLTGLGSTSSPLKKKIENKIPGYVAKLR